MKFYFGLKFLISIIRYLPFFTDIPTFFNFLLPAISYFRFSSHPSFRPIIYFIFRTGLNQIYQLNACLKLVRMSNFQNTQERHLSCKTRKSITTMGKFMFFFIIIHILRYVFVIIYQRIILHRELRHMLLIIRVLFKNI